MTTESVGLAALLLAAILVGVTIPALVQLRATLRSLDQALQRSGGRLDEALDATTAVAVRIDALATRLEAGGRLDQLFEGVASVSRTVGQLKDSVRVASAVGAAVGPAIAAAIHAFREDRQPAAAPAPHVAAAPAVAPPEPGRQATS